MLPKIFAPNIHVGGGFVLLQSIIDEWPIDSIFVAWIDIRAKERLVLPSNSKVFWVRPSILSRLKAEISLAWASHSGGAVLFFHGMPPLLPVKEKIIVFLQNRNLIGEIEMSMFSARTRLRLMFERAYTKLLRHKVDIYYVQTPSMENLLSAWHGAGCVEIRILPFAPSLPKFDCTLSKKWDFLYVADGEGHKNHKTLIEAWIMLSQKGFFPSLALTLSDRDKALKSWIQRQMQLYNLNVIDLGFLTRAQISEVYGEAVAIIYPSLGESFGMPLVEARDAGLPILAGELDFVRDVCEPVECFDPRSAASIARAVRRFLQQPEPPVDRENASAFLHSLQVDS